MSKKPSGLGRGLGDLLDDNTPSMRTPKPSVVVRMGESREAPNTPLPNTLYEVKTRPLFETQPRNKSFK